MTHRTSCTIVIEGRSRCVRDGGQWKECDDGHETTDFVRAIEREYERKNPASNTTAPALPVAPQLPMLRKRQAPSFTQDLPPAQGSNFPQDGPGNNNNNNNNNNDSGNSTRTPLSVFVSVAPPLVFLGHSGPSDLSVMGLLLGMLAVLSRPALAFPSLPRPTDTRRSLSVSGLTLSLPSPFPHPVRIGTLPLHPPRALHSCTCPRS